VRVDSFSEIAQEFAKRVERIVWCTVATVDAAGRPRSRILHPLWAGPTGWILTGRSSPKAAHLESHPFVSLSYWDQQHEQVHAECRAHWEPSARERARVWKLFAETPMPLGYDPGLFWKGADDPNFGALKLMPWRVELYSLADVMSGKPAQVWLA
jgi:general stress protein 26